LFVQCIDAASIANVIGCFFANLICSSVGNVPLFSRHIFHPVHSFTSSFFSSSSIFFSVFSKDRVVSFSSILWSDVKLPDAVKINATAQKIKSIFLMNRPFFNDKKLTLLGVPEEFEKIKK